MSGLNQLGMALSVVFMLSLVALVAELLYVLWRHRIFRRRSAEAGGDSRDSFVDSLSSSSKELLYFLCAWKHQSRVEPTGSDGITRAAEEWPGTSPAEVIDLLKLQHGLWGPSGILFTIKDEEKEDAESEKSQPPSAGCQVNEKKKTKGKTLDDCFSSASSEEYQVVAINVDEVATPFSTPCASPLYFTPSASPARESSGGSPLQETASFIRVGIQRDRL